MLLLSCSLRRCALLLPVALLLGAGPAAATSFSVYACGPAICYFGEDKGIFYDGTLHHFDSLNSESKKAELAFLAALGDSAGTEDFEHFYSGDEASLRLRFFGDSGSPYPLYTGRLTDEGTYDYGYVGTSEHEDRGFAIPVPGDPTETTFWKNRTEDEDGSLFRVTFKDTPMRAFGFYASAYSTLSEKGSTDLELELKVVSGATFETFDIEIPHSLWENSGNLFYFGVITPADMPFISARLDNYGDEDGDVIGFDDMTVSQVPEPSSGLLLGLGVLGLGARRRPGSRGAPR